MHSYLEWQLNIKHQQYPYSHPILWSSSMASVPSEKSSWRSSVDSYPAPLDPPQLPAPPASHSNIPSPANLMSPVTPPHLHNLVPHQLMDPSSVYTYNSYSGLEYTGFPNPLPQLAPLVINPGLLPITHPLVTLTISVLVATYDPSPCLGSMPITTNHLSYASSGSYVATPSCPYTPPSGVPRQAVHLPSPPISHSV